MKFHELAAARSRQDAAARVVEDFFGRFVARDARGARGFATEPLRWFGRDVARDAWEGQTLAAYLEAEPMSYSDVRALPDDIIGALGAPDDLFDGPLTGADRAFLVDFNRGTEQVTAGVVVQIEASGPRVARVFDPDGLRRALEGLGDPR